MRRTSSLITIAALLFAAGPLLAQTTGQIRGTVTDIHFGEPVAGATVVVVGTELVALTDAAGRYVISDVPAGVAELRVSRLGHAPIERSVTVTAGESTAVNFELVPEAIALEGVVVVGYGLQRRQDVTGAIASVRPEEIRQIPTPHMVDAIKGRVAGMEVVASGYEPGAGVSVRIRGERSLVADNEPLYVLDGIPLSGGIQDFNPRDIQSIEVLKDASATAIYGARGANGVVLITTARGRPGATQFTYDTYGGVQDILNPVRMMDGPQYAEMKREAHRTIGNYPCPDRQVCEEGDRWIFDASEIESMAAGTWTDYPALILRRGFQQSHQVGMRGGDERTQFSGSFNAFDQSGITRSMAYDRQIGSFSIEHTAGRLRAGALTQVSRSTQKLGRGDGLWAEALGHNPLGPPFDAEGNMILQSTSDGLMTNPLFDLTNWIHNIERTRLFGSLFAELELTQGLSWRVNFGPDLTTRRDGRFRGSESGAARGGPSDARQIRDEIFSYTLDNLVMMQRDFGDHAVGLTGLYGIQQERAERAEVSVIGLPYEHQLFHNLGSAGILDGVGSSLQEWALQSYMGRFNYGFKDKYLLTLTGRVDGSSRLAPGNKYAFFPSLAAAWWVSEEPFMAGVGLFSDLKLRASWGRTGNTAIAPYQTQGSLERTQYRLGDRNAFGFMPDELENPELGWERTEQFDVGLDFGVLENRITGNLDLYLARTKDLLMERQLPTATGFASILENIGETQNRGFELSLTTLNIDGWRGIRWTTDLNFALNRNKIVSLFGGKEDDVGNLWFIGKPINVWFDFEFDGIWQTDEAEEAASYGQTPGQIRVVDQNNDGVINADDRVIQGTPFPRWTGGLSNRVTWRSFDLSAFLTARQGFTIFDSFATQFANLRARGNQMVLDYWTPENPSNTHPRPDRTSTDPQLYSSARGLVDGSFIRVRNITLGYSVPQSVVSRFGGDSLRLYASAQDPFVFTSYIGFDPETGTGAAVPSYRTLLIGANLAF